MIDPAKLGSSNAGPQQDVSLRAMPTTAQLPTVARLSLRRYTYIYNPRAMEFAKTASLQLHETDDSWLPRGTRSFFVG